VKKPVRRSAEAQNHCKPKELLTVTAETAAFLRHAAENARYVGSPYHRPPGSPMGQAVSRRYPHASKCAPDWTLVSATGALREAIRAGRVSAAWQGRFPKHVWHLREDVLYECRLSNRELGEYHGYPLEDRREWPKNIR
jgi:hypothetical protein